MNTKLRTVFIITVTYKRNTVTLCTLVSTSFLTLSIKSIHEHIWYIKHRGSGAFIQPSFSTAYYVIAQIKV